MLLLNGLSFSPAGERLSDGEVHPFYRASFEAVYGSDHCRITTSAPSTSRTRNSIYDALSRARSDQSSVRHSYLFDVRACEEVSSVCLTYAVMEMLCEPRLRPLSIRGNARELLLEVFVIADSVMSDGERALVAVSEVLVADDKFPVGAANFEGCYAFSLAKVSGRKAKSVGGVRACWILGDLDATAIGAFSMNCDEEYTSSALLAPLQDVHNQLFGRIYRCDLGSFTFQEESAEA